MVFSVSHVIDECVERGYGWESYFAFAQTEAFRHSTVPSITFARPSLNFS
jgi:hypothetical protein